VELRSLQNIMREKYYERDRDRGLHATFTWLVEEVGELAKAVREGKGVEEEVADVLAWLLSVANLLGVDVEKAVKAKYMLGE